jgi:hypothetical protein
MKWGLTTAPDMLFNGEGEAFNVRHPHEQPNGLIQSSDEVMDRSANSSNPSHLTPGQTRA